MPRPAAACAAHRAAHPAAIGRQWSRSPGPSRLPNTRVPRLRCLARPGEAAGGGTCALHALSRQSPTRAGACWRIRPDQRSSPVVKCYRCAGCEPGRHSVPHVAPAAPPSPGPAGRGEGLGWVGAARRRDGRPARTRQPRRARAHRRPRPVPHGGRRRRRAYVARKGKRGGGALPAAALRSRGSAVLSAGRWMEGRRRKAAAAAGALPQLCACAPWAGACARSAADALGACSADALAYTQLAATLQTVSTIRTSSRA